MIHWNRIAVFYLVALAGISLAAAVLALLGEAAGPLVTMALSAAAMFSPLVGTLVVQRLHRAPLLSELGAWPRASRWIPVASALGLLVPALALVLGALLPGTAWDWEMNATLAQLTSSPEELATVRAQLDALPVHPLVLALPQAVVAGLTINAVFAFGEELGWRGFLLEELRPLGFWRANLLTGVLWGLWHAPLILQGHNYPTQRVAGVFLFTGFCVLISPMLAWVRERGQTVWAAAVLHGTLNAAAGMATLVVVGSELVVGVQGLAGVLALLLINLVLWGFAWRRSVPF